LKQFTRRGEPDDAAPDDRDVVNHRVVFCLHKVLPATILRPGGPLLFSMFGPRTPDGVFRG
jgi:hypothetical protein